MWTCIVFIVGALQNSASLAPSLYENCVVTPTMDDIDLNQLSASSEYPVSADFDLTKGSCRPSLATSARPGWAKSSSDSDPWIQVDFKTTHLVVAIATWGRLYDSAQYVTAYTVSYSMDSEVWQMITEDGAMKIFPGNFDRNTKVENSLSEQIQARLVRLHPKEYQDYPTMRWDVMVCKSAFSGHPRVSVLHGVLGGVVYNECDPLPATYSVNSSMISHLFDGNLLSCIRNPKRGMFFALRLFVEYQSGAPSFGVVIRGDFNCDSLVVGIGHPGNTRCNAKYRRCTPVAGGACQVTCLSDGDDVIMFGLMTRNEEFVLCDIQFVE